MNEPDGASQQPTSSESARRWRRGFGRGLLFLALIVVVALLVPSPIDPVAYSPPAPPPMTGVFAPNQFLQSAQLVGAGNVHGPEDVDVDAHGRVYGGTLDGKILRVDPEGKVEVFADTEGRPLGMDFDAMANLIVADAVKGLLSIDQQGHITVLATEAGGVPLGFADDVDVASDGRIYFSDASSQWGVDEYLYDLLEAKPYGRLLRHDPTTGQTDVLLDSLYFANGVALSLAEDFVVVNETYRYRVTRYWLKGPRAGESEILVENLPGFPDGISASGRGTFWVALFTVRNPTLDWLSSRPFVKAQIAKLPKFLWPQPEPYALVVELDEEGNPLRSLQDPTGSHLVEITSVAERGGKLYLGSLHNDRIGVYELPPE
jgi:sugar lactone lactonase YvrE